jgi:hypothetical protein
MTMLDHTAGNLLFQFIGSYAENSADRLPALMIISLISRSKVSLWPDLTFSFQAEGTLCLLIICLSLND